MENVREETLLRLPAALSELVLGLPGKQSCATGWACRGGCPAVPHHSHRLNGKPGSGKVRNAADLSAGRWSGSGTFVLHGNILNLIAKKKTRPNSTKHMVQKVSPSALWLVLGFGAERWQKAGCWLRKLRTLFVFPSLRTNTGRSGKMGSHFLAGILLQVSEWQ